MNCVINQRAPSLATHAADAVAAREWHEHDRFVVYFIISNLRHAPTLISDTVVEIRRTGADFYNAGFGVGLPFPIFTLGKRQQFIFGMGQNFFASPSYGVIIIVFATGVASGQPHENG